MTDTPDKQLTEWVKGNNIHDSETGECCPDFSCCQDKYKATEAERKLFLERPELRDAMLMGFLQAALGAQGKDVYIAGGVDGASYD